ncbi:MBL fold metallo-hydrolase [Pseudoalteromonas luteoviolacea]|uniref:Tyrosine beta-hydroxylase n=1 Tax=Pseudoalteromonas luteoviolacea S4060-1 TaxID=1365257 RepID=A0A167NWF1_9GAMM|nr:MBL fold metallo-hydrolase [Pseudoalteromonas luteoviolacea]KZN69017.1 hypothetical protein N478_12605 [Pseudoalteromonas luteoviolacea S4060-1]
MDNAFFLKESVYFEPLVNKWYAWPNLIAPLTYSMYMTKTHKRLMNSFVNNMALHLIASKDKAMIGTPDFINCRADQVNQVKALIEKMDSQSAIYQELAQAIKELNALLVAHTDGTSIEYLYDKVPDVLKGFIELNLDLYNNPSYRIIESLIYDEYYNTELQTVSFGVLADGESRPFVLSTPRFPDERHLHLNIPFDSSDLDQIFAARTTPISKEKIVEIFEKYDSEGSMEYMSLFTEQSPETRYEKPTGVRISYTGHAGMLVESQNKSILIDPVIPPKSEANKHETIGFCQLPDVIDYVCLTHNHSDHVNLETLLQIRHKVRQVLVPKNNGGSLADPSLRIILKTIGFEVMEVDDMDEIVFEDGKIVAIPFLGEHGDLNIRSKTAWFIELCNKRMYFGADSSNLEPRMYSHIKRKVGKLDVLALGMECVGAPFTWMYGALITEKVSKEIKESRRLNGSDFNAAIKMIEVFEPSQVFIYALGMEPWFDYFMGVDYDDDSEQIVQSGKLLEYAEDKSFSCERLYGKKIINLSA